MHRKNPLTDARGSQKLTEMPPGIANKLSLQYTYEREREGARARARSPVT